MTTPARESEADAASVAFHLALVQIGVDTTDEALKLWEEVPSNGRASTAASWLSKAVSMVLTRRARARDLATAYYRLARALRTGSTIPDPRHPEPTHVTLGELRHEFRELAKPQEPRSASTVTGTPDSGSQAVSNPSEPEPEASEDDDADRILIEEIERLREDEERMAREAEDELNIDLKALGTDNLNRKLRDVDTSLPADDVDELRDEAHRRAGARQAAAAARVAMNGGRGTVWSHASKDKRALGYVRVSRTGTPCGWCAMLISRGPVYKTEATATYADGDLYHDNDNCYAIPVFSREQFDSSEMFELNRQYAEDWPRVTKGLQGKAALSAWRYFIRQEQRAAAQEARSTRNVQEA